MHFISFGRIGVRFGFGVVAEVGEGISVVIVDEDEAAVVAVADATDEAGGGGLGNGCLFIFFIFVVFFGFLSLARWNRIILEANLHDDFFLLFNC